jgi:hypothetical protein
MAAPSLPGNPGPLWADLSKPMSRQAAVCKQCFFLWRKHILLGKTYAFQHTTILLNIWLSLLAYLLCLASAIWKQLPVYNGTISWIAMAFFPIYFIILIFLLLSKFPFSNAMGPFVTDIIVNLRIP